MDYSRNIIENIGLGIINCKNNEILYANATAIEMLNIRGNDLIALKNVLLQEYADDIWCLKKKITKEIKKESEIQKTSSEFLQALRANNRRKKFARTIQFYLIVREIEGKESSYIILEKKSANKQGGKSLQKNNYRKKLLITFSHELRTPINGI